jgi:hypothetical protein
VVAVEVGVVVYVGAGNWMGEFVELGIGYTLNDDLFVHNP